MKNYKVRFINGDSAYIEAEKVFIDDHNFVNFYTENDLIAKVPASQMMYMGLVDSTKEENENDI